MTRSVYDNGGRSARREPELRLGIVVAILFALALLAVFVGTRPADAQEATAAWTVADTYTALDEVSLATGVSWSRLYGIVRCETGGTLNPYAVGRAGELGAVQLHPRGELPRFYARGYGDPFNPHESIEFLAIRLQQGGARAWTCA